MVSTAQYAFGKTGSVQVQRKTTPNRLHVEMPVDISLWARALNIAIGSGSLLVLPNIHHLLIISSVCVSFTMLAFQKRK